MVKILKPLFLLLCLPFGPPAWGQMASLVADLGLADGSEDSSNPGPFLSLQEKVFFPALEASSGVEMWVSDGTAAGTELLADACPGECSSRLQFLGTGGGGVFWVAESSVFQNLLWWSDGTRAGTRPLRRDVLRVKETAGDSVSFAFVGGVLFFQGCALTGECDLWRSDGTEAGTRPVLPAPLLESVSGLQAVGTTVFFFASSVNPDLWKTDGTEAGTRFVKRLDFFPRLTAATADRFYFLVPTMDEGLENGEALWVSDGTEAGTRQLAFFPGDDLSSSGIEWLKPVGRRLYFAAFHPLHGSEIWRSDGTPQGTVRVTDFVYRNPFLGALQPWQVEEVGDRVVFLATSGLSDIKLWSSAGSRESMTALGEVCFDPGFCNDFIPSNWRLAKVGGRVVFRGFDPAHGNEIWSTDGTPTGTRRLSDRCPGPCTSVTADPVVSGSAAWLVLINREREPDLELWRSDGTPQGTRRFARLETNRFNYEMTPILVGNKIFFSAADEYGMELWRSDGTPEGTGPVDDIDRAVPGSAPSDLTPLGETLFFNVNPESSADSFYKTGGTAETTVALSEIASQDACRSFGRAFDPTPAAGRVFFTKENQLCVTDGTAGGTLQLTRLDDENDQLIGQSLVEHQSRLYFPVRNRDARELWRSDGTPAGTIKVLELASVTRHMASLGSELYFTASDGTGDHAWRSDGTAAGTRRLTDTWITFDNDKDPQFVRLGSNVFFAGDTLWKTNGTPQGTAPVAGSASFFDDQEITDLTTFADALYFFARTPEHRRALWRSDGTRDGTVIVKSFVDRGPFEPEPGHLTIFQGRLFFAADDGHNGRELWTSDGTGDGTTLVRDIFPGSESSRPSDLTVAGGKLFFAAADGLNGRELWESDGTAAGTRLRQDISPGATSSSPQELTVAGSRLFFSADDGLTGRELWALPLGGVPGCQPSSTILCLAGGRFRVEAAWRDFENRAGVGQAVGLTADTGYFWFFGLGNVEVVVKVLDGVGVNGHHWVFYGALSNVEYSITVTDTVTGASHRYFNPTGRLGSVGDTEAFGPRGAFSRLAAGQEAPPPIVTEGSTKAEPCVESATRLCLNGGRFAVEVSWRDFSGNTGTGKAVRLTGDTGYFWFFDDDNVELVLKVLDGRPVNGKFWVFYGALSSVEYTITVTDTVTGATKTYRNPSGRLASVADTGAF